MKKDCTNCKYAEWQKSPSGKRKLESPGKCLLPEITLPHSYEDYRGNMPKQGTISKWTKKECPLWEKIQRLADDRAALAPVHRRVMPVTFIMEASMSGNLDIDIPAINRVHEMCIESCDPETFEAWEQVKNVLHQNRSSLTDMAVCTDERMCSGCFTGTGCTNLSTGGLSGADIEVRINTICEFVKAYEKKKYEIMNTGGKLISVTTFMVDYCHELRKA